MAMGTLAPGSPLSGFVSMAQSNPGVTVRGPGPSSIGFSPVAPTRTEAANAARSGYGGSTMAAGSFAGPSHELAIPHGEGTVGGNSASQQAWVPNRNHLTAWMQAQESAAANGDYATADKYGAMIDQHGGPITHNPSFNYATEGAVLTPTGANT